MLEQLQIVLTLGLAIVSVLFGAFLTLGVHRPKRWQEGWREICLEVFGLLLLMLGWLLLAAWLLR